MQAQSQRMARPAPRRAQPAAAPTRRSLPRRAPVVAAALPDIDATTAAYWAIGAGGVSFVGTFGVAPLFKKSFKEDVDWQTVFRELTASGGVPSVTPAAAYSKRKSAALIDVRLGLKYEAGHPEGAASVPLYIPIQGWGPAQIIRRLGFSFFGIYGTQLNQEFAADAADVIPKGKEVILICENGGSLETKPGVPYGFQSRSLKAAYYLRKAGFNKVSYVQGGFAQWTSQGLPTAAGAEEDGDDGEGEAAGAGLRMPALPSFARRR